MTNATGAGKGEPISRYAAFISYSHADDETADWLHRHLEKYEVPKSVAGQNTSAARLIGRRLGKVFRDRVEFGAHSDLGKEIRSALDRSDALIVLCSPRSATSVYVEEEIRHFKSLGRGSRIFAAIVSGEPHAAGKPGFSPEDECFPRGLVFSIDAEGRISDVAEPSEPIAADFRLRKDGRENGALKLIAGILDIGLDDLVQREKKAARRRRARANAIAIAMSVLAAGAAVSAGFAFMWNGELKTANTALDESKNALESTNAQLNETNVTLDSKLKQITRLSSQMSSVVEEISQIAEQSDPVPEKLLFLSYGARLGISAAGLDLLLRWEFSVGRSLEAQYLSSVCVGANYCASDFSVEEMRDHWKGSLAPEQIDMLAQIWNSDDKMILRSRPPIRVERKAAINVFGKHQLPKYAAKISAQFPKADELHPDSFGALLCLYVNAGSKRFAVVAGAAAKEGLSGVPDAIMAEVAEYKKNPRLAQFAGPLETRRRSEADLFQKGLNEQAVAAAANQRNDSTKRNP